MTEQNLKYVDTHCHLDMVQQKLKLDTTKELLELIGPEMEAGLHIACDGERLAYARKVREFEKIYTAAGVHPHDAKTYTEALENEILAFLEHPKSIAWGEIGLDYHYEYSPKEVQKEVFARQLNKAQELELPVVIHTREADEDTLEIFRKNLKPETKLHIHCFTGSANFAQELMKLHSNLWFGFTGVITFKNAESIRDAIRLIPLEKLLLETDSPFMAPIPHRGKTCHSGMIPPIAEKIAEVKECTVEEVFKVCRENTRRLYGV